MSHRTLSSLNDFIKNASSFAKTTALAVMTVIAAASCSGKGDDPQPNLLQTSGNKSYILKIAIIFVQGGHPDAQPGSGLETKLTGIKIQTTNNQVFDIKSSSGTDKLIIPEGNYTKIRQNEYKSDLKQILVIRNSTSVKPDTLFFNCNEESVYNSFDSQSTHEKVVGTAKNGIRASLSISTL